MPTELFREEWTGADLAVWDAGRWKNRFNQNGGAVNILSNKGNLNGGTNAGEANAFAQAQTVDSFSDFEMTLDMTAQANTTGPADGHKISLCFRGANDSMINSGPSYRIYFEWLATDTIYLQEKETTTWATIASSVYAVVLNDVVHSVVRCEGSNIKFKVYKNAESVPSTWLFNETDTTLTTGHLGLLINGGTDTVADSIRFDDMIVNTIDAPVGRRPIFRRF